MSASNEFEAGRWLKARLEANAPGGINAYLDVIPSRVSLPAFRFQVQRRNDVHTVSQHIAISVYHFLVVATKQGEDIDANHIQLAEYITSQLHRASGVTSKARIGACTRVESYGDTENVGGDVIRHLGGIFEIVVYGLPESE